MFYLMLRGNTQWSKTPDKGCSSPTTTQEAEMEWLTWCKRHKTNRQKQDRQILRGTQREENQLIKDKSKRKWHWLCKQIFGARLFIRQDKRQDRDTRLWLWATRTHSILNAAALHRQKKKGRLWRELKSKEMRGEEQKVTRQILSTEPNLLWV